MQNIFNLPKEKVSAAGRLNGLRLRPFLARRQHSKPMSSTCTASSVNGEGCFTKVTLAIQHAIPFWIQRDPLHVQLSCRRGSGN